MSDRLSTRLLNQMNNSLHATDEEDECDIQIDMIDLEWQMIKGLKKNSNLLWTPEEQYLYYANSYSQKTKITAYTCIIPQCRARVYVREDGTAYRLRSVPHLLSHGLMYTDYLHAHCANRMKERAATAPASTTSYEIFSEVVLE